MEEWTSVVTHPLGLVGFVLFILFVLMSKRRAPGWGRRTFLLLAAISVLCALSLAYLDKESGTQRSKSETDLSPQTESAPGISQETAGDQSPAVSDVEGNVNIIYED